MAEPTLTNAGGTHGTNFSVEPHLTDPLKLTLKSLDGRITISIPTSMFSFLEIGQPPILGFLSISSVKFTLPEPEAIITPKLIGLGKAN